jgi:hypothetical protein
LKPEINISFDEAVPTVTHMAIVKLVESGELQLHVHYLNYSCDQQVNKNDAHNST